MESLRAQLEREARQIGFASLGICAPDAAPHTAERLQEFVDAGYHGQMSWMAERMHWRGDASALWPEARSIIMLADSYAPDCDPLDDLKAKDRAAISVYAKNRDYHDIVKKRLKVLGRWLIDQVDGAEIKVFVDTAPVMEKPLAAAAGLGWQGKHTNLVGRELGNWVFLGAIFTTVELPFDEPEIDHCGSCRACLDICPTEAFPAPYKLDARRCISYLTIEHKGPIDEELRGLLGNRIYGCDDCLAACPWNKFAVEASQIGYHARDALCRPSLVELSKLDDAAFRTMFSKNPIKRIGRNQFIRNVLYAIGNSENAELQSAAAMLLDDPDEIIQDAARWACAKLGAL